MLVYSLFSVEETYLFLLFSLVILLFLIIDLGILHKDARKISTKSALGQSVFWIVVSVTFGFLIYRYGGGSDASLTFFSAYLTEYALSMDNIFVILMILRYFKIKEEYYHKILFWGILGALVFRAIFIFLGAYLITQFYWILYIFGVFLIYSGIKIFFEKEGGQIEPEKNPILKFFRKYLKITKGDFGGKIVVRRNGILYYTPIFLVITLIETTDLIFAVDSIPAAFAITRNEFLIYTSNIFAVLGLRAKFFLLAGILNRFHLLQKGLSFVLIFIGSKMFFECFGLEIPILVSFMVIITTLVGSIIFSLLIPRPKEETPQEDVVPREAQKPMEESVK